MLSLPEGKKYMEGAIERMIRETQNGSLEKILEIAGIIIDDCANDLRHGDYSIPPKNGSPWIHPTDLRTSDGVLVSGTDFTHSIPSHFRKLPLDRTDERMRAKEEFELSVSRLMHAIGADILISDHYMARLELLRSDIREHYGKVLNIHPAVTLKNHPYCFRGATPTQDAINRAKKGSLTKTGATLHFVNADIDDGPPIAYTASTPVYPSDTPEQLRYRNYQNAKLPLLIEGIRYYLTNIYPHLDKLDINTVSPLPSLSLSHKE